MSMLIGASVLIAVVILALIAGYIGWFLSHKSYSDGFTVGYTHGRQEMYDQMAAAAAQNKPTLRPVK